MATSKRVEAQGEQADGVNKQDELTPEGQAVQDAVNKINAQGFVGDEVDATPNENYTVAGVTSGKPTPETDEKQAAKAGSLKFR